MCARNLISEQIAAFYAEITNDFVHDIAKSFFHNNHTLKFEQIYTYMLTDHNIRIYTKIKPILKQSQHILEENEFEHMYLDWLGEKEYIVKTLKAAPKNFYQHGTENVERILLLTATLEFALGNIYYTISNNKSPPHLLKDLLSTSELETFFGLEALTFLKIIIGTPKAVNLRNIVWHGFPTPKTIPTYYVSILLTIMHSLGGILQSKNFKFSARQQILDCSTSLATMRKSSKIPNHFVIEAHVYFATVECCTLIPPQYKRYWQQLSFYLQTAEYWRFVILILPQLELLLRLIYAKLNCFDVRAKLDEYYITLDTIFEPTVPNTANQANRIFNEICGLNSGALHFMYDFFLAPNGLRLRDKISHGEMSLKAIDNQELCETLLYLAFSLITQHEEAYTLSNYESQFHLNSKAKIALNAAYKTYNEFVLAYEVNLESETKLDLIKNNVKIFQRPKSESTYMLLITKIAKMLIDTSDNLNESIKLRQSLLAQHELHSKRRRTLENLIATLPTFCCCFYLVLKCLFEIFTKLQASSEDFRVDGANDLQRFLKQTLRIAENLVKYSHQDSNEWIKITELCKNLNEIYKRLYIKFQNDSLS